jgi:pimeloyl-ACP methyl ester carboxylesterase
MIPAAKSVVVLAALAFAGTFPHDLARAPAQAPAQAAVEKGEDVWLTANGQRLKSRVFRSRVTDGRPVLVVVLHGDLFGVRSVPRSTYHYEFAGTAATQNRGSIAAALLRPGYRDETGERSDGEVGEATGDNYTAGVVDAIALGIDQLKSKYRVDRTILVGHSGGAAISANLLGRHPGKADAALLVSCPCDLPAWRRHMQALQNGNSIWSAPINGLSPLDLADRVPAMARVHLIVGEKDDVAPPELTQRYADRLRQRNSRVTVTILPGQGHEILGEPPVLSALKQLVDHAR